MLKVSHIFDTETQETNTHTHTKTPAAAAATGQAKPLAKQDNGAWLRRLRLGMRFIIALRKLTHLVATRCSCWPPSAAAAAAL